MNRQSNKQETFNLGDPLPLSYLPTTTNQNKSKPNRFTSVFEMPQGTQSTQGPPGPQAPISHRVSSLPKNNANTESNYRIFNRTPSIRKPSQTSIEERIRNKVIQLNYELDEIAHEITDFELIDIKLDEILGLINDLKNQKMEINNVQDESNDTQVDELLRKFEGAKAKANLQNTRIKTASTWFTTGIYNSRYWILMALLAVALFFTSSVIAADFKYRYCYYFC
ncbi:hypothetical protein CANMA_004338 [Candida margitis]|uniref:uncharacterized protein n=1 Tax=Candida margitis TaxID=1775924 RepID=UPI0022273BFA|nr:uncharacterized protein CANMA_004338 [Candida margitis]KAI5957906.1 hypothetical protein CANMA_004338 [Candida margitis]